MEVLWTVLIRVFAYSKRQCDGLNLLQIMHTHIPGTLHSRSPADLDLTLSALLSQPVPLKVIILIIYVL